jgi:N-acetylmuramoyl-L-alanine amidase
MQKCWRRIFITYFILFLPSFAFADNEAKLTNLLITPPSKSSPNTQITLNLNQPVGYKAFTLLNPTRLVVDLQKTQYVFQGGKSVDFSKTDVSDFRHGIQEGYNLRIVFDLKQPMNFSIETNHEKGFQINLILSSSSVSEASAATTISAPSIMSKPSVPVATKALTLNSTPASSVPNSTPSVLAASTSPQVQSAGPPIDIPAPSSDDEIVKTQDALAFKKITSASSFPPPSQKEKIPQIIPNRKNKFIVVIDAGHGGKDPGAKGPRGTQEKNVTLEIAKDLQALVNAKPGMKAVMTRSGDYYVGLRQRLIITRKSKGDVFIAIHADAFNQPDAEGASVFALSLHGASSEAALWLAQKENYSELSGIDLNGIQDRDAQVRSVLIDLSQTAAINASVKLGQSEIAQLGKITELHHGIVEQAPFMVLKSPDVPSILVETGFITNPKEEARLKTEAYQEKIARALLVGINNYYQQDASRNLPVATSIN